MELRRYWKLITRRWLLVVLPAAFVLAISLLTYQRPPPAYNAGVQFLVSQQPSPGSASADEQRYYAWLTSEYVVNGLTDWVRGSQFAEAVSVKLAEGGWEIPGSSVQGGLAADNARSMLTLSLTHGDAAELEAMMGAAVSVLIEQNGAALPQLGGENALLVQLGRPIVNQIPAGIRSQLDVPLRILVALGGGIGLALLAEYLDPTVRDREDLARLGLAVIGEIPRK